MKKVIFILTVMFIYSCVSETPQYNYTVSLRNESQNVLTVAAINDKNEIVFQQILNPMESSENCTYVWETFQGFNCSSIDSISVVFDNGKGYACDMRFNNIVTEYCFSEKNPFSGSSSFSDLGNKQYEFIITEEDFNNAHDLPE